MDVTIVEGLVIRPGDTLIIRMDKAGATIEGIERLQGELHQLLPDVRGVVVVADGMAVQRAPELDDPARPLVDLPPTPRAVRAFDLGPLHPYQDTGI